MSRPYKVGGLKRWARLLWAAPLLFLLAENLVLWTPLGRWAIQLVPAVRLDYRFAYTVVPGQLTAFDAHMTVSDRSVQMQLDARRADLKVDLFALRRKTLHITRLRAAGVRFRMRPVLSEAQAKAAWVELTPPIDGVPMPPVWAHPERPEVPTEKLLKFHIEDLTASLEEVWVGPVRIEGPGQIEGGFELHPRTLLAASPTSVSWGRAALGAPNPTAEGDSGTPTSGSTASSNVRLSLGKVVFSESARLALRAELPRHELGRDGPIVGAVRVRVEAKLPFAGIEALSPFLPSGSLSFGSGAGELSFVLGMDKGGLADDVSLTVDSKNAAVALWNLDPPVALAGPLALRVGVQDGKELAARLDWKNVVFSHPKGDKKKLHGPRLQRLFAEGKVKLGSPLSDSAFLGGQVKVEGFDVPDLRFAAPLFEDTPLRLAHGQGSLAAELDVAPNFSTSGAVRAHLSKVALHVSDVRADFSAKVDAEVSEHPNTGKLRLHPLTLVVNPLQLEMDGHRIPWWFRLSTQNTVIDTKTGDKFSVLKLHGPSLQPFLDAMVENGLLRAFSKLVVAKGDTDADLRLAQSKTTTRLDLLSFKSGRLVVDGVLQAQGEQLAGAFLLLGTIIRVGVVVPPGQQRIHPTASRAWLEEELQRQGITKIAHETVRPGHHGDDSSR